MQNKHAIDILEKISNTLQEEADEKVSVVLKRFDSLSVENQSVILAKLGLTSNCSRAELTDILDTLELIDMLEDIYEFMGTLMIKH